MVTRIRTQVDGKWYWLNINDYSLELSQSQRFIEYFTRGNFICMRVVEVYADPSKPPVVVYELCRLVREAAKDLFSRYFERL
jgi:hypothetical protein